MRRSARTPLTAELTSLHVRYKNALRAVLPAGVRRPAEVGDLGPPAVACIRSTLFAQTELAIAILGDVERLAAKSRSATAVYERLREDVRDQTICDAITCGEVQVELSELELELELIQSHMSQKPMLRGEVDARALRV